MRKELNKLSTNRRYYFQAVVSKKNKYNVLLTRLRLHNNSRIITDHVWVAMTNELNQCNINDTIYFSAIPCKYYKGVNAEQQDRAIRRISNVKIKNGPRIANHFYSLAIVVNASNVTDTQLNECVQSIKHQKKVFAFGNNNRVIQILVVDNIKSRTRQTLVENIDANCYYASAKGNNSSIKNAGLTKSSINVKSPYSYITFIDADTILPEDILATTLTGSYDKDVIVNRKHNLIFYRKGLLTHNNIMFNEQMTEDADEKFLCQSLEKARLKKIKYI